MVGTVGGGLRRGSRGVVVPGGARQGLVASDTWRQVS
jgi:hypothetical protein